MTISTTSRNDPPVRRSTQLLSLAFLAVSAIGLVTVLNLTPIYVSDFWIQLKVGDIIRSPGTIPTTVLFSFGEARDYAFMAHEWLPSALTSRLFEVGGYEGLIVAKCGLALVVFAKPWALRLLGLVSILAPLAISTPHGEGVGNVPPELSAQFVTASLGAAALFWVTLGGLSGHFYRRFLGQ